MLEPDTMRPCNNLVLSLLLFFSTLTVGAQQAPKPATPAAQPQAAPLTEDRDPVRSPDAETAPSGNGEPLHKEGEGYILHQEVVFLDETDPVANPMKAKGVGELGICGVAAAVANAIYNATGVRVRDYPLTLDKLLANMPI